MRRFFLITTMLGLCVLTYAQQETPLDDAIRIPGIHTAIQSKSHHLEYINGN
jgi:hypothetical protein